MLLGKKFLLHGKNLPTAPEEGYNGMGKVPLQWEKNLIAREIREYP